MLWRPSGLRGLSSVLLAPRQRLLSSLSPVFQFPAQSSIFTPKGKSGPSRFNPGTGCTGTFTPGYRDERVTGAADGAVLVCWHPEPKFPYELSRPIKRDLGKITTHSKLQVQYIKDMDELYHHKPDRLKVRDLMRVTWTTKYKWQHKFKTDRYKEYTRTYPRDRPYM